MWVCGIRAAKGSLAVPTANGAISGTRLFSSTNGVLGHQSFRIPSLVLEELKKTTPIADVDASLRYVVLLPNETTRKGSRNKNNNSSPSSTTIPTNTSTSTSRRTVSSRSSSRSGKGASVESRGNRTRQGILRASIADLYQAKMEDLVEGENLSIDSIRPSNARSSKVTIQRFDLLRQLLVGGFTRAQMVEYVQSKYNEDLYSGNKKGLASRTKNALAEIIIEDIWGLQKTDELASWDELAVFKSVEMTDETMFLLLQDNGRIIRYLSRSGAKILFDPESMTFAGTELQVAKAEEVWNVLQSNISREVVNLENIKKLFMEKYKQFPILKFQKQADVFFKPLQSDEYELVAMEKSQLKRAKRLLLWLLNYNSHLKESIFLPASTEGLLLLPSKNDKAMPWTLRQDQLFELRKNAGINSDTQEVNQLIQKQLETFSDENMSNPRLSYETEIEFAKSIPTDRVPSSAEMAEMERTSLELLAELGYGLDSADTKEEVVESTIDPEERETTGVRLELSKERRDQLYQELTDFSHTDNLNGLENSNKVMTITLGTILFKGDEQAASIADEIIPPAPKLDQVNSLPYIFNSDVPLATDKVLSLHPYGSSQLSSNDINRMLSEDPSHYSLQLKYAPTPFVDNSEQLQEQVKYPQIEIWFDLDERKCVDIDTMAVVTVEGLNNCYVSLPEAKVDLKVTCQSTASMFDETAVQEEEEEEEDTSGDMAVSESDSDSDSDIEIRELLNQVTDKYARFNNQPGLREFLERSKLGMSGRTKVQIEGHIDFVIGGKPVGYDYLSVAHVRKLDFGYRDRFVQLSVVEGGLLGGRQVEVNIVGDLDDGMSREAFDVLVDDALRLVAEL